MAKEKRASKGRQNFQKTGRKVTTEELLKLFDEAYCMAKPKSESKKEVYNELIKN